MDDLFDNLSDLSESLILLESGLLLLFTDRIILRKFVHERLRRISK